MAVETINSINPVQFVQQKSATPQSKQNFYSNKAEPALGAKLDKAETSAAGATDQVELRQSTALKNLDTVRAIEQMHARLNELVKGVRETNEGLAQSSELTYQMQSQLTAITKNFPPFPIDSQERQNQLMNYLSLRKQIEQMSIPPPPPPIYENIKHLWDNIFSEQDQIRQEHLPQLDTSSSDASVKSAVVKISSLSDQITTLSSNVTISLLQR